MPLRIDRLGARAGAGLIGERLAGALQDLACHGITDADVEFAESPDRDARSSLQDVAVTIGWAGDA